MSKGPRISENEKLFVKVNASVMSLREMAKALNRNYFTIHRVLSRLRGKTSNHRFTPDEDRIMRQLYRKCSARELAAKLMVDETSIYNRAKKLGIQKKHSAIEREENVGAAGYT